MGIASPERLPAEIHDRSRVAAPALPLARAARPSGDGVAPRSAAVGAAAGHMLGGHAVAGAAAGALIQHERNKRPR